LKVCSAKSNDLSELPFIGVHEFKGVKIEVTSGDFSSFMEDVVAHMTNALAYASNGNQKNMVQSYIEHFRFGK